MDEKPPLGGAVYEEIEAEQYEIHKEYWRRLQIMFPMALGSFAISGFRSGPPEPRRPVMLFNMLGRYAAALFDCEARRYPNAPELDRWLANLVGRTSLLVLGNVKEIDLQVLNGLSYHATYEQMQKSVHDVLKTAYESRLKEAAAEGEGADHPSPAKPKRMPSTIGNLSAAERMEAFIKEQGVSLTEFATGIGITDRTLRTFRKTGKIRRTGFDAIAKAMGLTRDQLMSKPKGRT